MRIVVDPDQLRGFAQQLRSVGSEMHGVASKVGSVANGLDWEARVRLGVDSQVNKARNQANALASGADELARYLDSKANGFQDADQQGIGALGQLSVNFSEIQQQWIFSPYGPVSAFPSAQLDEAWRLGQIIGKPPYSPVPTLTVIPSGSQASTSLDTLLKWPDEFLTIAAPAALAFLWMNARTDAAGVKTIAGSGWIRDLAGVSENLGRIRPENLAEHLADQALGEVTLLDIAPILPDVFQDWQDSGGQLNSRFVASSLVDATLDLTINKGFEAGGAVLGGALLAPIGLAPVGAVIGYTAGGLAAGTVEHWLHDTPFRSTLVDGTTQVIDTSANIAHQSSEEIDSVLSGAANQIFGASQPAFQLAL
jgi:uncharacterized protein YukE